MEKRVIKLFNSSAQAPAGVPDAMAKGGFGSAGSIPAYHNHNLCTIQFIEFAPASGARARHPKRSHNYVYQSWAALPGGEPILPVIDALPSDRLDRVWERVEVTFTTGHPPRQFFSDSQLAAAFAAGEISLKFTGEIFWCPGLETSPDR